jgi:hypothetical protein
VLSCHDLGDNTFNLDGNLHDDCCRLFNLHDFLDLVDFGDDALDFDGLGYFSGDSDDFFYFICHINNLFNYTFNWHHLLHNPLHKFLLRHKHRLHDLNLHNLLNLNWHLHLPHNLHNLLHLDYPLHNPLHNLRHLHDLLNDPRNDDHLLDDSLHFDDLRYLHHLLDDLLDVDAHLFDALHCAGHLDDFLLFYVDYFGLFYVFYYWDLDLHYLRLGDVFLHDFLYLEDSGHLFVLDYDVGDVLGDSDYPFLEDWHLHLPLDNLFDFVDQSHDFLLDFGDLLNLDDRHQLLPNNLDLFDYSLLICHRHNLLDNLWHFHNPFDGVLNDNNLLDEPFNFLYYCIEGDIALLNDSKFWNLHDLLHNLLDFDYTRNFDNLLNDLFDIGWNFDDTLNDLLDRNEFFDFNPNLLDFNDSVVHDSLDFHNFSYGNVLDDHLFHFDYAWYLDNLLNDPFSDLRNFDDSLDNPLHFDDLFDISVDQFDDLYWNVDDLFDLLDFGYFDNLLNDSLNDYDLGYLNISFHDLFNNLLDFHNFGHNCKHPEYLLDIDNSCRLLPNHREQTLRNLQGNAWNPASLLKLDQQRLDKNPQVVLQSFPFFVAIGVDVFDADNVWDVLHDLYDSVELVDLDDIDELLLYVLEKSAVEIG